MLYQLSGPPGGDSLVQIMQKIVWVVEGSQIKNHSNSKLKSLKSVNFFKKPHLGFCSYNRLVVTNMSLNEEFVVPKFLKHPVSSSRIN